MSRASSIASCACRRSPRPPRPTAASSPASPPSPADSICVVADSPAASNDEGIVNTPTVFTRRVTQTLDALDLPLLSPPELLCLASARSAGTYTATKDVLLALLCRSFRHALRLTQYPSGGHPLAAPVTHADPPRVPPRALRNLDDATSGTYAFQLVLKFASNWNAITGSGSTRFKRDFNRAMFCEQPHVARQLDGKNAATRDALLAGPLKVELKQFIRRLQDVITARNRLLEMYNHFGAVVVVDLVWDVDLIRGSPEFPRVFRAVAKSLRLPHRLPALHGSARHVVLAILTVLGDRHDVLYADAFFDANHPSRVPCV
ncbi:uncharacterized protein FIBRA_08526 [Fibroporia radiculosa]|uniref:Uncharacterized protein n=1 Tax=Fibroporia radiculosa TaxID=599839 RepID=J4ICE6_9APHY|nr:uncharacterized protein FIBRA_08526 [Fibroporia radiculosa]CCM06276.1 predicted protein [Fibroporia radiculosa]